MRIIRGAVLDHIGTARPFTETKPISIDQIQLDAPGPGEVLIKIGAAGVCHSDLSVVNGDRPRPTPMLLGHESAGVVVEVGEGVELAIGQKVVMTFLPRCGECAGCATEGKQPCVPGSATNEAGTLLNGSIRLHRDDQPIFHHIGVSGFATHAVVSEKSLVAIGDDVPLEIAAVFGCALLTGGGALLNVIKPRETDTLAIVGLGGVGMAALLTAKALGVARVVGVDANPEKLHTARELGADDAFTPDQLISTGERFNGVVEAAGHPKAFETAVAVTAPGGTTVTVGLPAPGSVSCIDPLKLTGEARTIVGSYLGSSVPQVDIPHYERLWREGKLPVEKLISDRIRLEDLNEAMDNLSDGKAIRQVILFEEE